MPARYAPWAQAASKARHDGGVIAGDAGADGERERDRLAGRGQRLCTEEPGNQVISRPKAVQRRPIRVDDVLFVRRLIPGGHHAGDGAGTASDHDVLRCQTAQPRAADEILECVGGEELTALTVLPQEGDDLGQCLSEAGCTSRPAMRGVRRGCSRIAQVVRPHRRTACQPAGRRAPVSTPAGAWVFRGRSRRSTTSLAGSPRAVAALPAGSASAPENRARFGSGRCSRRGSRDR